MDKQKDAIKKRYDKEVRFQKLPIGSLVFMYRRDVRELEPHWCRPSVIVSQGLHLASYHLRQLTSGRLV